MLQDVATKRTTKAKTKTKPKVEEPERGKSKLVEAGDKAMRELLEKTLKKKDWDIKATAEELNSNSPNILRAIERLGLEEQYLEVKQQELNARKKELQDKSS